MAYSTDNDLLKEFTDGELISLAGESQPGQFEPMRTAHARQMADALIDAHLLGRYKLPLDSPEGSLVNKLSIDLTVAVLYEISGKFSTIPETIYFRKSGALKIIEKIGRGEILLPGAPVLPKIISNRDGSRNFSEILLNKFKEMTTE